MSTVLPEPAVTSEDFRYEPIEEDREFLQNAVTQTELPALLAALALTTGDASLVGDSLRPPLPSMESTIAPQGGMTAETQEQARAAAVEALIRFRDADSVAVEEPSQDLLHSVMRFLTNDAGEEYVSLLQHEIGIPEDIGAPTWTMGDAAPGLDFRVAVIGAGISGLAAGHRLDQAGVAYTIFEKNAEVGGTWWENVYPGCRLDTPNFAYSFSFAQRVDWPDQFSTRDDIFKYLHSVSEHFGVRRNVTFGVEVTAMTYDQTENIWVLEITDSRGAVSVERFNAVITAVGQLNRPSIPEIPGLDDFAGRWFHSSAWDVDIDVTGKKVAVVGTGASAFQIVPAIVDSVNHMSVFQRHAPWMLPTPTYHDSMPAGMSWLLRHVPYYGRCYRFYQFWLAAEGRLPLVEADPDWTEPGSTSAANKMLREQLLGHLRAQLTDRPDLLQKMTPDYAPGVKRMTRDNGVWAAALKQPHVDLVTEGIDRITAEGVVTADGELHEADIIVFATGFRASDYLEPIKITGREGVDLHKMWNGDARAYLGITIPSFPNLFMLMGPNTGVVVNGSSLYMAECAAEYAVETIGELIHRRRAAIEPTPQAVDEFCRYVDAGNLRRAWGVAKIQTWYQNRYGRASQVWPYSLHEFFSITRSPDMSAFELSGDLKAQQG